MTKLGSHERHPRLPVYQPPVVPAKVQSRPPSPDEISGIVEDAANFPQLAELEFSQLVDEKVQVDDQFKQLKARQKELGAAIEAALAVINRKAIHYGSVTVTVVNSQSASQVSRQKLLDAGVSADVIAECTEPGNPFSYVKIMKDKGK